MIFKWLVYRHKAKLFDELHEAVKNAMDNCEIKYKFNAYDNKIGDVFCTAFQREAFDRLLEVQNRSSGVLTFISSLVGADHAGR